jgi:hypothetical protein
MAIDNYSTDAGKALASIIRQKMDRYVSDDYSIDLKPYCCINALTTSAFDFNMKAWLATAEGISEYMVGYMQTSMKTNGAYVYIELAIPPPPPPILPAMATLNNKPTFGIAKPKDPYSILTLALPTMIFAGENTINEETIKNDPTKAIKDNLKLIALWLNIPPVEFDQKSVGFESPQYSLNGTGMIIFPNAFSLIDTIAQNILNAMKSMENDITYIDANNMFSTGIVNMLNGNINETTDIESANNKVFSFDSGMVSPEASNKVPMIPGTYFGFSTGKVLFQKDYQLKVQVDAVVGPPFGTVPLVLEITLPEFEIVDLNPVVESFIDTFFVGLDLTSEERQEMINSFGDVLKISFNGITESGVIKISIPTIVDDIKIIIDAFVSLIEKRLSIDVLVKILTKRMFNFSAKLRSKIYSFFEKIGVRVNNFVEDVKAKVLEVIQKIFKISEFIAKIVIEVPKLIIDYVIDYVSNFITETLKSIAISVPLPASAALAALAEKIEKAINIITTIVNNIKEIIEDVVMFINKIIETVKEFVLRIVNFINDYINKWIETINEWINAIEPPQELQKCLSSLDSLNSMIATLGVFTTFIENGNSYVPALPSLPSDFDSVTATYYVSSGTFNFTSASMKPQGNPISSWGLVESSATSAYSQVNNGSLQDSLFANESIGIFSADNDFTSDFKKVYGSFTTSGISGNPYNGSLGISVSNSNVLVIFNQYGIDEVLDTSVINYSVYRMYKDIYYEVPGTTPLSGADPGVSAMSADYDKRLFYGYFIKVLTDPSDGSSLPPGFYKGWILESLLNTSNRTISYGIHRYILSGTSVIQEVPITKNYLENIKMIKYFDNFNNLIIEG